jgi:glycosyltransferase involved in cell wall biosynthesis
MKLHSKVDFTVITASKNSSDTIPDCIASVKNQIKVKVQHLVFDSASNDGIEQVINSNQWNGLSAFIEPDSGIYNAWNKALKLVKGEWVVFLGSDDIFYDNNVLYNVKNKIKESPDFYLHYGKVRKERVDGELIGIYGHEFYKYQDMLDPPTKKFPPHPAIFFHNSLFKNYPVFDESFKICADSLHLAILLNDIQPNFVDQIITSFRAGGISNDKKNSILKWREKHRVTKLMNYKLSVITVFVSLIKAAINQVRGSL